MFPKTLAINTMTPASLIAALNAQHVGRNKHAEMLLVRPDLQVTQAVQTLALVVVSAGDLADGQPATLANLIQAAASRGLAVCPLVTGAYLRLAYMDQPDPDVPVHAHRAPIGSLTVMSKPLSSDVNVPKGFYLRMIDGRPWLRGYVCDDSYAFNADDHFVFQRVKSNSKHTLN